MSKYVKTIITFLIYLFLPAIAIIGCQLIFNFKYDNTNIQHLVILNVAADSVFFIIFILLNRDVFKNRKPMKGNNKLEKIINYIVTIILGTLLFYAVKIAFSILATMISMIFNLKQVAQNQELLELTFKSAPILMTISGVILAPVIEELVFRGSIRRVIKNKWVFVIVSGLLFGLVHVLSVDLPILVILIYGIILDLIITSSLDKNKKIGLSLGTTIIMIVVMLLGLQVVSGNVIELLKSIPPSEAVNSIVYIAAGVYLGFLYQHTENIYVTIGCHMINNLLAYILLFTL